MFGLFKRDPLKKLRREYDRLLAEAMHCQRNGDIRQYSLLTERAENLYQEIRQLEGDASQG